MRHRVTANTVMLALLVALPPTVVAQTPLTTFGCDPATLKSPDGKHVLIWQSTPKGCNGYHALLLSDANGGREQVLLQYDVPLTVSWSPDSNHFFVDDHRSSDFDSTYVFSADGSRVDLFKSIENAPDQFARGHLHAGHVYLIGLRWMDSGHILIELTGHFDQPPATQFKACYVADVLGDVTRLQAQETRLNRDCADAPIR